MLSNKTIQVGAHNVNGVLSKAQYDQMMLKVYLPGGLNSKIKLKWAKAHFNKQSWVAFILSMVLLKKEELSFINNEQSLWGVGFFFFFESISSKQAKEHRRQLETHSQQKLQNS